MNLLLQNKKTHYTAFNGSGFVANTAHFPNFGNTNLIALTQWQYWWWFWFTFLLALYFVLTLRILYTRTLSLHPKITTSLRSHGRWGDLIICAVPIFWCLNILTNSHFLLRHLEWQTENSLFTLRVRGKQWYWVYKFDLKGHYDVNTAHVIIGRNKKIQAIRSDPTKWSLMSTRALNVYTVRDRARDPFEKLNSSAARLKNPNLFNRVKLTPGVKNYVTSISSSLLTANHTHKGVKEYQPVINKLTSLFAAVVNSRRDGIISGKYDRGSSTPTWLLWLKQLTIKRILAYRSCRRIAFQKIMATLPTLEQMRSINKAMCYKPLYKHIQRHKGDLVPNLNVSIWPRFRGASTSLFIEQKALPFLGNAKKLTHDLVIRTKLSMYSQKLVMYIRLRQVLRQLIKDSVKAAVGNIRNRSRTVTLCTAFTRAIDTRKILFFHKKYQKYVNEITFLNNPGLRYQVIKAACTLVFAEYRIGKRVAGGVLNRISKGFQAPKLHIDQAIHSELVRLFSNRYFMEQCIYLTSGDVMTCRRVTNALKHFASEAAAKALCQVPRLLTSEHLSRSVMSQQICRLYINHKAFLPKKPFKLVNLRKVLAIELIKNLTSAYLGFVTGLERSAIKGLLLQKATNLRLTVTNYQRSIKIVATPHLPYTPLLRMQPKITSLPVVRYLAAVNLNIRTNLPKAMASVCEETLRMKVRLVSSIRVNQIIKGIVTASEYVDWSEDPIKYPQEGPNRIYYLTLVWLHPFMEKKVIEAFYYRRYTTYWTRHPLTLSKILYNSWRQDLIYNTKLGSRRALLTMRNQGRACRKTHVSVQKVYNWLGIDRTVRGLAERLIKRSLNALWVLEIRRARRMALISPGRQAVFGSLRRYIRRRASIKYTLRQSALLRQFWFLKRVEGHRVLILFIERYLNIFLHQRWWVNRCPKCHHGYRLDARLKIKQRKWRRCSPRWSDLTAIRTNPTAFLTRDIINPAMAPCVESINKSIRVGNSRLNLGSVDLFIKHYPNRLAFIQGSNPIIRSITKEAHPTLADLGRDPMLERIVDPTAYAQGYRNAIEHYKLVKGPFVSYTMPHGKLSELRYAPQGWINIYYPVVSAQQVPVLKPLAKDRWLKNQFTPNNRIQLFRYNMEGAKKSKQLLKLHFTSASNQTRDLNSNTRITYIQKKNEPVTFTTGLAKYETVFDNKSLYREFDTVVTGTEGVEYQKLRIRKDKENLLTLRKRQAYRREIQHSKRLLWVTKQIILPIRTPITIITNSYDVIHSWFIPGLGLKMDCVPGRSTHHTIFIDKPGYYYGQCAEVCGRRHHHMPIKILAVPFVHFLYWWNKKIRGRMDEELNTKRDDQ